MKPIVVSDDYTIINTQGIRLIEKVDEDHYSGRRGEFCLIVSFRKERFVYHYKQEHLRNAQYQRLRNVLDKEYGPKEQK